LDGSSSGAGVSSGLFRQPLCGSGEGAPPCSRSSFSPVQTSRTAPPRRCPVPRDRPRRRSRTGQGTASGPAGGRPHGRGSPHGQAPRHDAGIVADRPAPQRTVLRMPRRLARHERRTARGSRPGGRSRRAPRATASQARSSIRLYPESARSTPVRTPGGSGFRRRSACRCPRGSCRPWPCAGCEAQASQAPRTSCLARCVLHGPSSLPSITRPATRISLSP